MILLWVCLPPRRGVCIFWPGSLSLLFLFSYCSSSRPPLQSISHPSQKRRSRKADSTITINYFFLFPCKIVYTEHECWHRGPQYLRSVNFDIHVVFISPPTCWHHLFYRFTSLSNFLLTPPTQWDTNPGYLHLTKHLAFWPLPPFLPSQSIAPDLLPFLNHLINSSLTTGCFPNTLNAAGVNPRL